ncbi:folate-binding protein YgfZ [Rhizobium sp. SSA_523]|uniref:CAF17-like 4Fe-4S cluster assembly/insertion protein YgfZ n=1 Tax=Rhizobium sp. SSA_523 TaxID=2952477 RepID=UPI002091124F|nr:folate-binding protein YgfZ [Rhizobium sp. SSA_523]MCO5730814.1 folate-binding protein YgfZ [Rhizobium sp. SSA_523]WKC24363.1 folate-binding protein YgfZ [Rhizobium sp. SSA_523]
MPSIHLSDRSLIDIAGADAQGFLHNLITTDVEGMPEGEARPGALLTPQGKILFDFLIWRHLEGFRLECDTAQQEALIKRLSMYKLRAAVTLAPAGTGVLVVWGEEAKHAQGVIDLAFQKAGILVKRQAGGPQADEVQPVAAQAYNRLRIQAGLALAGQDYPLQDAFPHDVTLDLNGGLSFRKGCYVGQEVVSRMQHRGTARRRLVQVAAQSPLPAPGTEITAGGKPLGSLGTVDGAQGLAIVRIDRVGEALAAEMPILAGGMEIALTLPAWTGLAFPTEPAEGHP